MQYLQTLTLIVSMIFATSSFASGEHNRQRLATDHASEEIKAKQGDNAPNSDASSTKEVKAEEECD